MTKVHFCNEFSDSKENIWDYFGKYIISIIHMTKFGISVQTCAFSINFHLEVKVRVGFDLLQVQKGAKKKIT